VQVLKRLQFSSKIAAERFCWMLACPEIERRKEWPL